MCIRDSKQAVALRSRYMPLLRQALAQCRNTGEPVLRPMAYNFTEPACARVTDQFIVGDKLLVAPILEKGATRRTVYFPKGSWCSECGERYDSTGEVYEIEVGDRIGIFEKESG